MVYKINALADKHEQAIQSAFFWEISTRNRPKPSQRIIHNEAGAGERERFRSFRNDRGERGDRKPKRFNKGSHAPKENSTNHHSHKIEKNENKEDKIPLKEKEETLQPITTPVEGNSELAQTPAAKEGKPFKRNKYRNRFRRYGNKGKKQQNNSESSAGENSGNSSPKEPNP